MKPGAWRVEVTVRSMPSDRDPQPETYWGRWSNVAYNLDEAIATISRLRVTSPGRTFRVVNIDTEQYIIP